LVAGIQELLLVQLVTLLKDMEQVELVVNLVRPRPLAQVVRVSKA
jgi:hypothetical protein